MNCVSINDLPDEVFFNIFSRLGAHTVRCVLPRVSRRWAELAANRYLWRSICFEIGQESSCVGEWPAPIAFLQATTYISRLSIELKEEKVIEILKEIYSKGVDIKMLDIMTECCTSELFRLLPLTLEELHLEQLPRLDDYSVFQNLTNLNTLYCYNSVIPSILRDILSNLPNTTSLCLSRPIIGKLKQSTVDAMSNLENLTLNTTGLDHEEIASLTTTLSKLKRFSCIDGSPTPQSLEVLVQLPLVDLKVRESKQSPVLSHSAIATFLSSAMFYSLRCLQLQVRICDEGAVAIRTCCPFLETLEITQLQLLDTDHYLTEYGILQFLHLQFLRHMEVILHIGNDWIYRRHKWGHHACDPSLLCPIGLDALLDDWDECDRVDIEKQ